MRVRRETQEQLKDALVSGRTDRRGLQTDSGEERNLEGVGVGTRPMKSHPHTFVLICYNKRV